MERRPWRLGASPTPIINAFVGEYEYMSNLYPAATSYRGQIFPSSEHAYVAAKTLDQNVIRSILDTHDLSEATSGTTKSGEVAAARDIETFRVGMRSVSSLWWSG